ncbi:aspartyl-phosphate phosphatase Spo0E family protein [Brevibacillus humidisoli]|uniref:aspartyl-phosphate phosphatase Spo0E family protein n=1 Tax=Brevibacillus humidisoli TaxID=2895522 RepID=UPI001E52DD6D|nr:aspartyl-phosphate phosphatase Spo0E family protein [Brevibacillus humidisoli]UFJ43039.1 aspartyl-phosphate phosphatase Spo0E family protein [Brevibacillus humidisoli]
MTKKRKRKGAFLLCQAVGAPLIGGGHTPGITKENRHNSESSRTEEHLLKHAESLRQQLVQLKVDKGSFLHREVVELSQRLDQYIVALQNRKAGL